MDAVQNKLARMQDTHSHHVFHRGKNRERVFYSDLERAFFLELCSKYSKITNCELHAYCLMSNHFHLLVTPKVVGGLSEMMRMILSKYARWFNKLHLRSGAVWGRKFQSIAIDSDIYVLSCMKYIELNPCRAGIVDEPEEFFWSSYRANALGVSSRMIEQHD
jgi:putative transposase